MASNDNNPNERPGFFARLKQHHIYRVVVVYAVACWVLLQLGNSLFPDFGLARGDVRYLIVALLLGFPVVLVLAWMLIKPKDPAKHTTWQKLHWKLGSVLALVVLTLVVISGTFMWRAVERHAKAALALEAVHAAAQTPAASTAFNPPADTLVVLPFTNLSEDKSQQYFSDGITEELTNALGQTTGLKVIAWGTASHYRDSKEGATDIGQALDVANVLTGKILRQGNTVRVIVELVNARTGYQVWAYHYDDTLANVFQVQDKISAAIAGALKVKFAGLGHARTVDPQAYDLVLQARALTETAQTAAPFKQARTLYEQAIALDPAYADAHAGLAMAWFDLTQYSTLPLKDALPKVRAEANRALALDPRNVDALGVLGSADEEDNHIAQAKAQFEQALALDPSDALAHLDYGNVLPLKQALAQELEAVQLDPDDAGAQSNLAGYELDSGNYQQALTPAQATLRLDPHSADNAFELALIHSLLHRNEDAVKAFDLAEPDTSLAKALVAAGRLTYQSVLDPSLHAKALVAVEALGGRPDLDPFSMGDVIQLYLALGQNATALELLPRNCAAQPVGCNDLGVNPVYVPLHGQPRFEALVQQYDTVSKPAAAATAAPASATTPP